MISGTDFSSTTAVTTGVGAEPLVFPSAALLVQPLNAKDSSDAIKATAKTETRILFSCPSLQTLIAVSVGGPIRAAPRQLFAE
jgi:hypothetical protein